MRLHRSSPTRLSLAAAFALSAGSLLMVGCDSTQRTSPGAVKDTVTFKVDGMACPNCAKHIEEELAAIPGVRTASVNFATKSATVTVDPANPATMQSLEGAVAHWKKEHFAQEEDPECLDPARRAEIKAGG
jgi:Cu+-exporting ATPase